MGSGLSMSSRAEITAKFAKAYVKASKKDKVRILDQVVGSPAGRVTMLGGG
jgi:hypothetical protein